VTFDALDDDNDDDDNDDDNAVVAYLSLLLPVWGGLAVS
jgi:hypothetical protein